MTYLFQTTVHSGYTGEVDKGQPVIRDRLAWKESFVQRSLNSEVIVIGYFIE